jgi:hypothetical protein
MATAAHGIGHSGDELVSAGGKAILLAQGFSSKLSPAARGHVGLQAWSRGHTGVVVSAASLATWGDGNGGLGGALATIVQERRCEPGGVEAANPARHCGAIGLAMWGGWRGWTCGCWLPLEPQLLGPGRTGGRTSKRPNQSLHRSGSLQRPSMQLNCYKAVELAGFSLNR